MTVALIDPIRSLEDAQILAQAIVNTIPEPFLVLDEEFRVLSASRSFYDIFQVDPVDTQGRLLFALGDGQWNIPALRHLLETIIPDRAEMDNFEVGHDFPTIGPRIMLLNARKVLYDDNPAITILLAFRDITARRAIERSQAALFEQAEELLRQKQVLFQEMQHRVANSLQIIASILLLKARAVSSEETRYHLNDAHQRVMSVAAVQQSLHAADGIDQIEVAVYLEKLSAGLSSSMVGESRPIAISATADSGMIDSSVAVSMGLIVTELVINAIKYAFPEDKADAAIRISYEIDGADWRLAVSENGVGLREASGSLPGDRGLGTSIINALTKQLDARVERTSDAEGLTISITRARFTPRVRAAA